MEAHKIINEAGRGTHRLILILMVLFSLTLSGCVTEEYDRHSAIKEGDPLPDFKVTLSDGRTVTTAELRGKTVVIELFNTECPDCQETLPVVNELYLELKGNDDVEIFAIARDETAQKISAYWSQEGFTLPWSPQPDRKIFELFASVGIPRLYIADPSGIVVGAFTPDDRPSLSQLLTLLGYEEEEEE